MDVLLKIETSSKKSRKKFKYHKPYCNEHLTALWKIMRIKEKEYNLHTYKRIRTEQLYYEFKSSQKIFDKELPKAERKYNRGFCINIEQFEENNPRSFWKHISALGPQTKKNIPMQARSLENEEIALVI